MKTLAPGNILQNLYFKKRIKKWNTPFSFVEIGAGIGVMSNILLNNSGRGIGIDLNEKACTENQKNNDQFIEQGKYTVVHGDFLNLEIAEEVDVIVSMMVIEHLSQEDLSSFMIKCKKILKKDGLLVLFVPSCKKYWGIEDEIAGHFKRYEFEDFSQISQQHQFRIWHIAGLTFPVSNLLFPLSNYFVKKAESHKLNLSERDKTILSGKRDVPFKTDFPTFMGILLNEYTVLPLHLLQMLFRKNPNSMVIYCELKNG